MRFSTGFLLLLVGYTSKKKTWARAESDGGPLLISDGDLHPGGCLKAVGLTCRVTQALQHILNPVPRLRTNPPGDYRSDPVSASVPEQPPGAPHSPAPECGRCSWLSHRQRECLFKNPPGNDFPAHTLGVIKRMDHSPILLVGHSRRCVPVVFVLSRMSVN